LEQTAPTIFSCSTDELRFEIRDGIWRFLLPERQAYYAQFIKDYETVRGKERRGATEAAYYRALPYQDLSGQMAADWRIRAASMDALLKYILTSLEKGAYQPLTIFDLGAGNCWLSNHLAKRGHNLAAVDLTVNDFDGLGCYKFYESSFSPIQAEFDNLPMPAQSADLIIFNASLHYSENYLTTLSEALRVMKVNGRLVILDTPVYQNAASGMEMVHERETDYMKRYGFASNVLKSENYLSYEKIEELGNMLNIQWKIITPNYGFGWWLRPWKARLRGGREPAKFHVLVGSWWGK
jgi:ubiquinone/menaquinone biosynthesis C-methylase UbiE